MAGSYQNSQCRFEPAPSSGDGQISWLTVGGGHPAQPSYLPRVPTECSILEWVPGKTVVPLYALSLRSLCHQQQPSSL